MISLEDGRCRLTDLDPTSGTFLNGQEVRGTSTCRTATRSPSSTTASRSTAARCRDGHEPRHPGRPPPRPEAGGQGEALLHDVSLSILPGELVAIVGGSGAGKTTLHGRAVRRPAGDERRGALQRARLLPPRSRSFRQRSATCRRTTSSTTELPLRLTLHHAAQLRLPPRHHARASSTRPSTRRSSELGLTDRADVRVGQLSGGQRKRASIGVELLTRPRIFFLDEPTSGLDPGTDGQMMRLLRRLADDGQHRRADDPRDQERDAVRQGRLPRTRRAPGVRRHARRRACATSTPTSFDEIYERLAEERSPRSGASASAPRPSTRRSRRSRPIAADGGEGARRRRRPAVGRTRARAAPVPGAQPPQLRPLRAEPEGTPSRW